MGGGPGPGPGAAVGVTSATGARRASVVRFQDEQPSDPSQLAGGGAVGGSSGVAMDEIDHPHLPITRMGSEKSYGSEMSSDTGRSNDMTSSNPPKTRKLKRKSSLSDLLHRRAPVEEVIVAPPMSLHPINILFQHTHSIHPVKTLCNTFVGRSRKSDRGRR